jgi:hypothetical protein
MIKARGSDSMKLWDEQEKKRPREKSRDEQRSREDA